MGGLAYDGGAMPGRQLRRVRNSPGLAVLTQTMPITMLLFFGYVFGSALSMPGPQYRSFLVPGLLMATAANGVMTGMFQAAQDTHRGVMDRFRTLPMSRAAVPLGQAVADLLVTAVGTVPFLPGRLRTIAEWNPISAVTTALRVLFGNAPVPDGSAWLVAHPVAGSLAWCGVLLAVFLPLAVRRYATGDR
ncbi:ABC transporter permease [Streptomyces rhizosphaerihabitans]|uniref:ABC transporter permease n=1 Tax=Streptomyces rhizosphaerihabitans TaxID=1266770 RepID=UPI0021C00E13|nr:ABC transporter permease [Streptomyces rhizosphaerihabitans]MCT9009894.1 ABC transporter permease [Streptomyces rhizosphaerihabitans]